MLPEISLKTIWYDERPIFSEEYEKQVKELLEFPFVQNSYAVKKHAAETNHHVPAYHYINAVGFMNDPNGFCYYNGYYHLFYQQCAETTIYWGHAVSRDLVRWFELPYAIYPGPEGQSWSGTTCVEKDRVSNIYYGQGLDSGMYCATSHDPLLLNWTKVKADGPSIRRLVPTNMPHWFTPDENDEQPYNVFDPCIWKQGDRYYALSGGTKYLPTGSKIRSEYLYTSEDLVNWTYLKKLVDGDNFVEVGDDGACPYFFPIGDKYMYLYYSHMNGARYLLGDYDPEKLVFKPFNGRRMNETSQCGGYNAPSGFAMPDGSAYSIYIMHAGCGPEIMSLPHKLTLGGENGDMLCVEPGGDLESLRSSTVSYENLTVPANRETVLEAVNGNALEIELEVSDRDLPCLELRVLRSEDGEEYTSISFYNGRGGPIIVENGWPRKSMIAVNCDHSSRNGQFIAAPEHAEFLLGDTEPIRLRVFVDRSVVEVFANGKGFIGRRVFPSAGSTTVSLMSYGKDAKIDKLNAHEMMNVNATLNTEAL